MLRNPSLFGLVVIISLLWALPVFADDAAKEEMMKLNDQGFEAFSEGRFRDAALTFEKAYDAYPDPNLRKNEAIAWFKAEDCSEAITAANAYLLADETRAEDSKEVRSVVANCKVKLAREALDAQSTPLATALLDEAESLEPDDYARDQIQMMRLEIAKHEAEPEKPAPQPAAPDSSMSTLGWVLTGVGSAIIVGSLVYHLMSLSDQSELKDISNSGGDRARYDELQSSLSTARWLVPTLYGVGGATAGVGAIIIIVSPATESTKPAAARLKTTPVEWSVGVKLHF